MTTMLKFIFNHLKVCCVVCEKLYVGVVSGAAHSKAFSGASMQYSIALVLTSVGVPTVTQAAIEFLPAIPEAHHAL